MNTKLLTYMLPNFYPSLVLKIGNEILIVRKIIKYIFPQKFTNVKKVLTTMYICFP